MTKEKVIDMENETTVIELKDLDEKQIEQLAQNDQSFRNEFSGYIIERSIAQLEDAVAMLDGVSVQIAAGDLRVSLSITESKGFFLSYNNLRYAEDPVGDEDDALVDEMDELVQDLTDLENNGQYGSDEYKEKEIELSDYANELAEIVSDAYTKRLQWMADIDNHLYVADELYNFIDMSNDVYVVLKDTTSKILQLVKT